MAKKTLEKKNEVMKTKDYSIFKKHSSNRAIDNNSLKKLIFSIQTKNLLQFRPILVDADMNIIDGQHRLEAAKELNLDVFYQIQEDSEVEDMILLNSNQRSWNISDYVNFFADQGKIDYVKLKKYMSTIGYRTNLCVSLLHGNSRQLINADIRLGKYKFPSSEQIKESEETIIKIKKIKDYITQKTPSQKHICYSINFTMALVEFLNVKSVDFNDFFRKFEYRLDLLRPCARKMDYHLIFKEIYNWRSRSPLDDLKEKMDIKARQKSLFD